MNGTWQGPIAIIGAGQLGSSLLEGLVRLGVEPSTIHAATRTPAHAEHLAERFGVIPADAASAAAQASSIIIISVRPDQVVNALDEIHDQIQPGAIVVSMAAGVKLEFIKQALLDLNIADPDHRLALDLAYYSRDSIVDGIGILQAKSQLGTVPSDADAGRYLCGIIRNAYDQAEISLAAESYLRNRLYLRDLSLRGLVAQAEEIRQSCSTAQERLWASVDRALAAPTTIDYHFWALRSAETISGATLAERPSIYRSAAKRIAASYRAERLRKQSLLTRLARVLSE